VQPGIVEDYLFFRCAFRTQLVTELLIEAEKVPLTLPGSSISLAKIPCRMGRRDDLFFSRGVFSLLDFE
jgi:hypothetical protein